MVVRRGAWVLVPWPLFVACQINAVGSGSGPQGSVAEDSGDTGTVTSTAGTSAATAADGSGGGGSTSGAPTTGDSVDTTEGSASTGPSGAPLLEISDGPAFDFGPIPVATASVHLFMVTNAGDGVAEGIAAQPLGGAFDYEGGAYPGTSGTCGASLDVGTSCAVAVSFAPAELGLHAQALRVDYDGGETVNRPVSGGATGISANLLTNPGGEDGGAPPSGWTNIGAGNWLADNWVMPYEDAAYISAYDGPNNQEFQLSQEVPVGTWASTIDAGAMRFSFEGWVATLSDGNDGHRIRVRYRDSEDDLIDTWESGWGTGGMWAQRSHERLAPVGTRTVEVELACRKFANFYCDAYFDALVLQASYP